MAALEALEPDTDSGADRRQHQRVSISLLGRCMFLDQSECPCELIDISPGGAAVVSPICGRIGERVIAYIDQIGRLEGTIVRLIDGGFAMTINASSRKRDKLADILTWLANRHVLSLPEDRRHVRRAPRKAEAMLRLADGTELPCRVIDMSLSGAALCMETKPPLGSKVQLGKLGARVIRHFDDGIAIEFMRVMSEAAIEQTLEAEFF